MAQTFEHGFASLLLSSKNISKLCSSEILRVLQHDVALCVGVAETAGGAGAFNVSLLMMIIKSIW